MGQKNRSKDRGKDIDRDRQRRRKKQTLRDRDRQKEIRKINDGEFPYKEKILETERENVLSFLQQKWALLQGPPTP